MHYGGARRLDHQCKAGNDDILCCINLTAPLRAPRTIATVPRNKAA